VTPAVSILVAVRDGEVEATLRTVASLQRQDESNWQMVLAGTALPEVDDHRVKRMLAPLAGDAAPPTADLLEAALGLAEGGHTGVLGAGDELEPGALSAVLPLLASSDVVYTDEQWPGDDGTGVFRKPDYLPHYHAGYSYLGRLTLVSTALARQVGGFRSGFDGAEEWDLALRACEAAGRVAHLPAIAVTRPTPPPDDDAVSDACLRVAQDRITRSGRPGAAERSAMPRGVRTWWAVDEQPLVSIVIPTAGGRGEVRGKERVLVESCLTSLVTRTTGARWEVVLVTSERTPAEVVERCREIVGDRLTIAPVAGAFNFSTSVNEGARVARGELVLLLNDDTEAVEPRWLERMVAVIQEPDVGVVGAKLLFEDSTLQHVGVSFDDSGGPIHVLGSEVDGIGRFGTKTLDIDYEAVTGACLLTSAELFERVGGFAESLPLSFNDVDFCLKVRAQGWSVVCTPAAILFHYESGTRRHTVSTDEFQAIDRRWGLRRRLDPHVQYRSRL